MTRPYDLLIPVEPEYLEAAGEALYNFAYAEGIIVSLVNSLVPGYITLTRGRTADEIANDLKLASAIEPRAEVTAVAGEFSALAQRRDSLLESMPVTGKDGAQLLSTLGETSSQDWNTGTLWKFAEDAQNVALTAQKLI